MSDRKQKSGWFVLDGAYYCTEHRMKNCLVCDNDESTEAQGKRSLEETLETVGKIQEKVGQSEGDLPTKFEQYHEEVGDETDPDESCMLSDSQILDFIRKVETQAELKTARRIADAASLSGLSPKELTSVEKWKEAVRKVEQRGYERGIEEVKEHIRNWNDYDIGLMTWIDQLKQKRKEGSE